MKAILLSLLLASSLSFAQQITTGQKDTTVVKLNEVVVEAYQYRRPLSEAPVSLGYVDQTIFKRFNNTSLLPALNTVPGVRMEERSPGSYRLSVRGSTLRSPFGVRNVKVYWNDLPFTDPGGNTYLNLLDFNSVQQAEIIKGPGGSLYGAGTGGVLLLKGSDAGNNDRDIQYSALRGSFGLLRYTLGLQSGSDKSNVTVQYAHQQAEGYRQQSAMTRDVLQAQGTFKADDNRKLNANIFYADLSYQTPGGLTRTQYEQNPSQARPTAGPSAGAVDQKATVYNKTFFAGLTQEYTWSNRWSNRTAIYGTSTQFENPTIRNYEHRTEQSFGARSTTEYDFTKGKLIFGGEYQHGFSPVNVYNNNGGKAGTLQTNDEITSNTSLLYAQVEFFLPGDFFLTGGVSINFYDIRYIRLSDPMPFKKNKGFNPVLSPRIALLKKLNEDLSVYGSISQGFSPPTVAELYPSTATFNSDLDPEKGVNYELGTRGTLLNKTITFDLAAYSFQLNETIVIRRTDDNADYFVNAGKTSQKGIEAHLAWSPWLSNNNLISHFSVWSSYAYNHYRFSDYLQDTINFSGNELTGAPANVVTGGIDINTQFGLYVNITVNYTDRIPLNDANTDYADAYTLAGARLGYRLNRRSDFLFDLFAGVDNLFDERYSLGNDLNAAGGRYYNAAATRNFYVGLTGKVNTLRKK